MSSLLVSKKTMEDSVSLAHNYEGYYQDKAKKQMNEGADTVTWHKSVDSSTFYWAEQQSLKEQLKAVNFSIDSLSKMK